MGLFSLEKRRFQRASKKDGNRLFSRAYCNRTRGDGFNLKEDSFRLDIRKKISMMRLVKHWNMLHKEAADIPFLATFKARLNRALNNLI